MLPFLERGFFFCVGCCVPFAATFFCHNCTRSDPSLTFEITLFCINFISFRRMGNEPGKESLENGHGNDSNRKKTGKRSKKEGMHIESRPHEGRRTFKKVDDTVLGHPLNDDIEKYYTVTDKILGMYVQGR